MVVFKHLLCCCAVLAAAASSAWAQAAASGEVMFVSGSAVRRDAGGAEKPVELGMTVHEGDRMTTGADSHVYVRLRDGGLLVLRPASVLHIDRWHFDPEQPQQSQIKYTLQDGVARHVSGRGAQAARDKFRFNTPLAAIGVRGTDFTVMSQAGATRVAVRSGGVIVSGLGAGCRAEGLGPCEGDAAVELFASAKDRLLQVRMGERRPELIENPGAASPDRARPPARGEPAATAPAAAGDAVAESRTSDFVDQASQADGGKPFALAAWGRWARLAVEDPAGVVPAAQVLSGRSLVGINSFYVLAANPLPVDLPGSGSASFRLLAHEGVVFDRATSRAEPATVSDGSLTIDFGRRRFETSLTLHASQVDTTIQARGAVEANGQLLSDPFVSPAVVQGRVGGKNASEAAYLYQRNLGGGREASGVAAWRRAGGG